MWYRGGLSLLFGIEIKFWYRDSAFCYSASRSSSSWDQPVRVFFWASSPRHPVNGRSKDLDAVKKIEK